MVGRVGTTVAVAAVAVAVLLYARRRRGMKQLKEEEFWQATPPATPSTRRSQRSPSPRRSQQSSRRSLPPIDTTPATEEAMDALSPGLERHHSFIGGDRTQTADFETGSYVAGTPIQDRPRHESFAVAQIMS